MTGFERLDQLVQNQVDSALLKIVDYLKSVKGIEKLFLNEEKSLKEMMDDFIKVKAKEVAINNVAILNDDEVFNLALTYWQQPNEALGIKKEEPTPAPVINNVVTKKEKMPETAQLSLF